MTPPRILIIAGSDSGGGAGIQADIKTVTMFGGHAMTAITAITAQNTLGVQAIMPVPADTVVAQMNSVISDIGVDAVKIGMIGSAETADAVAERIERLGVPIVFDPVMVATSGAMLADSSTIDAFLRLAQIATVTTPNAPELSILVRQEITTCDQLESAALALFAQTRKAVLAKGGHLQGACITDLLIEPDGTLTRWDDLRFDTLQTHGTGCTLASAVATSLGWGASLSPSVVEARNYVRAALQTAPGFGYGHGPINHTVDAVPWGMLKDPFVPEDDPKTRLPPGVQRRNIHRK